MSKTYEGLADEFNVKEPVKLLTPEKMTIKEFVEYVAMNPSCQDLTVNEVMDDICQIQQYYVANPLPETSSIPPDSVILDAFRNLDRDEFDMWLQQRGITKEYLEKTPLKGYVEQGNRESDWLDSGQSSEPVFEYNDQNVSEIEYWEAMRSVKHINNEMLDDLIKEIILEKQRRQHAIN